QSTSYPTRHESSSEPSSGGEAPHPHSPTRRGRRSSGELITSGFVSSFGFRILFPNRSKLKFRPGRRMKGPCCTVVASMTIASIVAFSYSSTTAAERGTASQNSAVILDLTEKQRERGGEAKGWRMPLLKAKTVIHLQLLVGIGGLKIGCCFSSGFLGL
ncbi:hypothetical protein LINPERPRIM_LOCUS624, partial [Linum perenne]